MNTTRIRISIAAIFLCATFAVSSARAQVRRPALARNADHATPEEVQDAIEKAQACLISLQGANGGWEGVQAGAAAGGQTGGISAAATYALLASGLPSSEKHVGAAVAHLKSIDMQGTYALGLRCQVWYQLSIELDANNKRLDPARLELDQYVEHDAKLLLAGVNHLGDSAGMYTYFVNRFNPGSYDHSCSNYGAMGVWACAQAGAEIPQNYWAMVDKGWKSHQAPAAGWAYTAQGGNGQQSTPAMTAGGLVNLFITQEFLDQNKSAECKGNFDNPNIEAAIQWLGTTAGARNAFDGYTSFNIQRVGAESGYISFVDYDWYSVGADALVRGQGADGSWRNSQGGEVVATAFGLAFLSLGRAPVVMNKLQYEDPTGAKKFGNWNQHSRDAANITRWIEKQLHKRLNWQIVNFTMPLEILHQSPILYIAGNQKLKFTEEQSEKLKRYVLEGGLIVANADCGSKEFAASFKQLGEKLFPDYAFRPLPAKHPIFNDELFPAKDEKKLPAIEGLGNQARELMLLFPGDDPGRAWQMLPQVMQNQIGVIAKDELYHVAGNLFYYSTERGLLRDKKKTWILPNQPKADKKITVARLEYDGNWNPEPFGWEQMANYLRKHEKVELEIQHVRLGSDALDAAYKIAYLTGTAKIELTEKQRQDLKRFTYEGGLLIVDAAGGSAEFAESIEKELKLAFERDLQVVPLEHSVYRSAAQIKNVKYREKAEKILGKGMNKPILKMIEEDGKVRVLYSPLDLAVGLVGQPIDSIAGYQPESAAELMMNMIVYGLALR